MIFDPSTFNAISHALNSASVISVSTQNQSSLSLTENPNSRLANSLERLSDPTPVTTLGLIAQANTPTPTSTSNTNKCGSGQPRDKHIWPFACDSIWNMPIGANAKYVDAQIGSKGAGVDTDWFITTKESDPVVPTYMPGGWSSGRCTGTTPQQQAQWHSQAAQPLNVPEDLIISDARQGFTPNNSSAFLMPDGKTLVSFNVTARCEQGGSLYGVWFGQQDIYGDGINGGHGGSGMSSVGGSIRKGELLNDDPIRHALKIVIWGKWLHYNPSSPTPGHRWPARMADSGAPNQYQGSNPALVMGSLLAVPPNTTAKSLGLTTKAGKKIFQAMQDYGAYVVDDSGWDYNYLCLDRSAEEEYEAVTGQHFNYDQALQGDLTKIIGALKVVDNNEPNSIGGGGTPRQPLAPPIGN